MKKITLLICLFLITSWLFAQNGSDIYVIKLKDKNNSVYSLDQPLSFLSEKAISRRERMYIAIDKSDLPISSAYLKQISNTGVKILNRSRWMNSVIIMCNNDNIISKIGDFPFVSSIKKINSANSTSKNSKFDLEQNSVVNSRPFNTPNPVDVNTSRSVLNYGYAYKQAHQINVDCLHNMGFQGQGMTIAVLDAGFYAADTLHVFDSLRNDGRLLGTWDFVAGDTMVFEDFVHGMNVLSCMAANIPGQMVGTAPKASYWLLRTEDAASESIVEEYNWLSGAEFADSVGADVINSSLGYSTFDNSADNHTYADLDGNTTVVTKAADWAASKGIAVVISAGNLGGSTWQKITAPADADSILTVGAIDSLGGIGSFSSHGPSFDGRIKPDVVARGVNAYVASSYGYIIMESGTSFSSPIAAGGVACLLQANPNKTNMELIHSLQQSANQYSAPDTLYGFGIPDFCNANTLLSGIKKFNKSLENLVIYPNPAAAQINLEFTSLKKEIATIKLLDMMGKLYWQLEKNVEAGMSNHNTININQLAAGMYMINVEVSGRNYYQKFVKQ